MVRGSALRTSGKGSPWEVSQRLFGDDISLIIVSAEKLNNLEEEEYGDKVVYLRGTTV